jgi:hypothetical protein
VYQTSSSWTAPLGAMWPLRISALPNNHFALVRRHVVGQGGWPALTCLCWSPRILVVEGGGQVRNCNSIVRVRGLGLRGLLDMQKGARLPSAVVVLSAYCRRTRCGTDVPLGTATGLSCGSLRCCVVYVYSLLSEWFVRTVSLGPGNIFPVRMVCSYCTSARTQ